MSALLKRSFEGLGYAAGDYADAAAAATWLETHELNGLSLISDTWTELAGCVNATIEVVTSSGNDTQINAHGTSMLTSGQKIADLTLAKAIEDGSCRIEVHDCRSPVAILPSMAAMASRGVFSFARWQENKRQFVAVLLDDDIVPRVGSINIKPSNDYQENCLALTCSTNTSTLSDELRSIMESNIDGAFASSSESMQQRHQHVIQHGLAVDATIWNELIVAADAVLVAATEQSRRGAGA